MPKRTVVPEKDLPRGGDKLMIAVIELPPMRALKL